VTESDPVRFNGPELVDGLELVRVRDPLIASPPLLLRPWMVLVPDSVTGSCPAPAGMQAQSEVVGTRAGFQLAAVSQSELTAPVQSTVHKTVKFEPLVAVPLGVVTVTLPVVAPFGTVVVIEVLEATWKLALVALKFTAVAPVKLLPEIVTGVPTGPLVGENDEISGVGMTV
jgi:hypothetical protein